LGKSCEVANVEATSQLRNDMMKVNQKRYNTEKEAREDARNRKESVIILSNGIYYVESCSVAFTRNFEELIAHYENGKEV
jgi:hypothetical protein